MPIQGNKPTPEQFDALKAFKIKYGKGWIQKLKDVWTNGEDARESGGCYLRQYRNAGDWDHLHVLDCIWKEEVAKATSPKKKGDHS